MEPLPKVAKDGTKVADNSLVSSLKDQGGVHYAKGEYKEAIVKYTQALELFHNDSIESSSSSRCGDNYSNTIAGDDVLNSSNAGDDSNADSREHAGDDMMKVLYCNRALCYASLGEWDKCIAEAKMSLKIDIKFAKAHFRLIKASLAMHAYRDARLYLLRAFQECGETADFKNLETEVTKLSGIPARPRPNHFEVLEELGSGNFSTIYKCSLKSTGKIYSLKAIEKQTVERMKKRHGNINNEILMEKRVLNKLDHVNIVRMFTTFQDYGTLYFQMEFLAGGEVWNKLFDTRWAVGCHWSVGRFIIAELISALEYIHGKGIVHRDLKVENMMLTECGHLKLIDFGTSKDLVDTDLNGPEFVGTPEYMSPQTLKSKPVGVEADLWALGVIIFQIFTGHTPFGAASPYLTFLKIKRGLLQKRPLAFTPHMFEFLNLLLELDPDKRLRNALGINMDDESCASKKVQICYDTLREHPFFEPLVDDISINCDLLRHEIPPEFTDTPLNAIRSASYIPSIRVPRLTELCIRTIGKAATIVTEKSAELGGLRPDIPWMQRFDLFAPKMNESLRMRIAHCMHREQRLHIPTIFRLFHTSVLNAKCLRANVSTREYIGHCRDLQGQWSKDFFYCHLAGLMVGGGQKTSSGEYSEQDRIRKAITVINKIRPRFLMISGNFSAKEINCDYIEDEERLAQVEIARKMLCRVSETIPMVFVPGCNDVGTRPTPETLKAYHDKFGADYYGFWYGGARCLVINSMLMIDGSGAPLEAAGQDLWFEEEIEQAKMCSIHIMIFSYHPWFISHRDESTGGAQPIAIPEPIRAKWLTILRHKKVKYLFAGTKETTENSRLWSFKDVCSDKTNERYDRIREKQAALQAAERICEMNADGEPLKPSEIIAQASNGDAISFDDVHVDMNATKSINDNDHEDQNKENTPTADERIFLDYSKKDNIVVDEDMDNLSEGSDESEFLNQDEDYPGPQMIATAPMCCSGNDGVRIIRVYEDSTTEEFVKFDSCPKNIEL